MNYLHPSSGEIETLIALIVDTTPPSQDGSTINDEITSPNEPSLNGLYHCEHEERLVQRGSCCMTTLALYGPGTLRGSAHVSSGSVPLSFYLFKQPASLIAGESQDG